MSKQIAQLKKPLILFPPHVPLQKGSIIIFSGPPGAGKTTAATSIAPRALTAYIDCEASGTVSMSANPPAIWHDVVSEYHNLYPDDKTVDDIRYVDLMLKIFDEIEEHANELSVVIIDNTKKLKTSGLRWAYANKQLLELQTTKTEFVWGAWNNYLTERLQRLALRVGLLVIVVHLQDEYENGKATGILKPRVWEALEQAASLIFWLEKGAYAPRPDALLRKARAAISVDVVDGVVFPALTDLPPAVAARVQASMTGASGFYQITVPIFPPVIRGFGWDVVKNYMNSPYSPSAIQPHEIPTQEEWNIINDRPSEMVKQAWQAQVAELNMATQAAQELKEQHRAEMMQLLYLLGDKADEAKEALKKQFGGYSDGIHAQCVAALHVMYPNELAQTVNETTE